MREGKDMSVALAGIKSQVQRARLLLPLDGFRARNHGLLSKQNRRIAEYCKALQ